MKLLFSVVLAVLSLSATAFAADECTNFNGTLTYGDRGPNTSFRTDADGANPSKYYLLALTSPDYNKYEAWARATIYLKQQGYRTTEPVTIRAKVIDMSFNGDADGVLDLSPCAE